MKSNKDKMNNKLEKMIKINKYNKTKIRQIITKMKKLIKIKIKFNNKNKNKNKMKMNNNNNNKIKMNKYQI